MRRQSLLLASFAGAALPGAAPAQDTLPAAIAAFTQDALAECRAAGGTPSLVGVAVPGAGAAEGEPPFLTATELNGDAVADYVTDLAGLACAGAASYFCGSAGCPVTVWLSGAGGHEVGWSGHAQAWRLEGGELVLFLHGQLCDPPRVGAEGCRVTRRLAAAPPAPAGWVSGEIPGGAGWFAGIADAAAGRRVDWLCAAGRGAYLAVSPWAGGTRLAVAAGGQVEEVGIVVENGVAYALADPGAALVRHILSGPAFTVSEPGGPPLGTFPTVGAAQRIADPAGRCGA